MGTTNNLTKEQRIKKELLRLRRIFNGLDANKKQTVEKLLGNAAFMVVTLEYLQDVINIEGYSDEYRHGENQSGRNQSVAIKTHIAMTKNYTAIIKLLTELTPPEQKKASKFQAFMDE